MKNEDNPKREEWPVMEQFYTIQGEGYYSGRPAYFIRIGGCDVGCVWCDVKESWNSQDHKNTKLETLIENVKRSGCNFVVITGGEPAMYKIAQLVDAIKALGIETAIETSGCYKLDANIDWYCFSPKKFKPPVEEAYLKANELKVVIFHKSDFEWAESHALKLRNKNCKLYIQPEWSKEDEMLPLIINYVKENPKWNISLQTHKYMQIP